MSEWTKLPLTFKAIGTRPDPSRQRKGAVEVNKAAADRATPDRRTPMAKAIAASRRSPQKTGKGSAESAAAVGAAFLQGRIDPIKLVELQGQHPPKRPTNAQIRGRE